MGITLGHSYCSISIIYIGNSHVEWEMLMCIPIRLGHVVGPQPARFSGAQVERSRMGITLGHSYCSMSIIYIGNSNVEWEMLGCIPIRLGHVVGPQPARFSGAQVE